MNNDAFRDLVLSQGGKTTKQIAREAVEEEARLAQRKRRRRTGGKNDDDYCSSDEEDSRNKKKNTAAAAALSKNKQENDASSVIKYRDRAKERRAGKAIDYEHLEHLRNVQLEDADMTKYLGGDEAHTHLVKGLDVVLSRRVKEEMSKKQGASLSLPSKQRRRQQQQKQQQRQQRHGVMPSGEESSTTVLLEEEDHHQQGQRPIEEWNVQDAKTALGKDMLAFLQASPLLSRGARLGVSSAGLALQQASFSFSCRGHPGDRMRAWEIPLEQTTSAGRVTRAKDCWFPDLDLLDRVRASFETRMAVAAAAETAPMTKATRDEDARSDRLQHEGKRVSEADSSDDDIFDDAGEYVPTIAAATTEKMISAATASAEVMQEPTTALMVPLGGDDDKKKKGSIFDGLRRVDPSKDGEEEEETRDLAKELIAKLARKSQIQSMQSAKSDFANRGEEPSGYGEDDMDADFAGQLEHDDDNDDDDEKKSKKKKKKSAEETTMASLEYGRRETKKDRMT